MKITTLVENLVYKGGLKAEHGLSILIETKTRKILFDTGQSDLLIYNAQKLGFDLQSIDTVVISHGHNDHTGGLNAFLKQNKQATIYACREAWTPKYKDRIKENGMAVSEEQLKGRIQYIDRIIEIDPGIFLIPNTPVLFTKDTHFERFYILKDEKFQEDQFLDELFIAIRRDDQISVLSSCSHRGISNILHQSVLQFKLPINLVLGGFHTKGCSTERINATIESLLRFKPLQIGVCHCSGVECFAALNNYTSCNVFYNYTGNIITL